MTAREQLQTYPEGTPARQAYLEGLGYRFAWLDSLSGTLPTAITPDGWRYSDLSGSMDKVIEKAWQHYEKLKRKND